MKVRDEVQNRIRAAEPNYFDYARTFRPQSTPMFGKVLLFKCLIVNTLLAGLATLLVDEIDVANLEKAQMRLARRLLGRYGYRKVAGDARNLEVTEETVRATLGILPIRIMLRRRIMWYFRGVAMNRKNQILAALLGKAGWDGRVPIDDDGIPNRYSCSWLKMLHRDLLDFIPEWTGFVGDWEEKVRKIKKDDLDESNLVEPLERFPAKTLNNEMRETGTTEIAGTTSAGPNEETTNDGSSAGSNAGVSAPMNDAGMDGSAGNNNANQEIPLVQPRGRGVDGLIRCDDCTETFTSEQYLTVHKAHVHKNTKLRTTQ